MDSTTESPEQATGQATERAEPSKRRALGRGLESLLPSRPAAAAAAPAQVSESGRPREIPLDQIDRNPFQTRTHFDEQKLRELAASIMISGVVQPILVRPLAEDRFLLIAGERRWLASRMAGKATIPAILRTVSDEQALEITIIENLQRADLNPIEQARAFERLARDFKLTQDEIGARTGKDRTTITNFLRLLRLPAEVQESVEKGELSFGHARALLALDSPEAILSVARSVAAMAMSVRQTEALVQGQIRPELGKSERKEIEEAVDPNVREAQERLQAALGLKVRIEDRNGRGRVVIEYGGLEDFDTLLTAIVGE